MLPVKFSVIVPAYNSESTLERCVKSLAEGRCTADMEIIVVEDCSRDDTWAVCEKLAVLYPEVKCLRNEKNCGVSYTRNRGLQAATGDYVLFTDSDDWVEPDYIASFQLAMEKTGCSFAVCGFVNHDEKCNRRTDVFAWKDRVELSTSSIQEELKALYDANLLQQLWNKVFVLSKIRETGLRFDESISIGEDLRFILEYLRAAQPKGLALINRPLYHYMRDQAGSLMYRVGYESVEEPLKNLRMLYELMGMPAEEIEQTLQRDRQRQIELYAYLIYHNAGMKAGEKKQLILALDKQQGMMLYRKNRRLFIKERLSILLDKLGVRHVIRGRKA